MSMFRPLLAAAEGEFMFRSRMHTVLLFLSLTIAFGFVHAMAVAWGQGLWWAITSTPRTQEYLFVTDRGEPLIGSWPANDQHGSYRTLDGVQISKADALHIKGAAQAGFEWSDARPAADWSHRISAYQDFEIDATYWYFVLLSGDPQRGCFEGYDKRTKRPVGYLSLNGFTPERPGAGEYFPIGSTHPGSASAGVIVAMSRTWPEAAEPFQYSASPAENAPLDVIWLLSNDRVYELRLKTRTVRLLFEGAQLRQISSLRHQRGDKVFVTLVLRTDHEFLFIDPGKEGVQTWKSQRPPIGASEQLYVTDNDVRLRVITFQTSHGVVRCEIIWCDESGIETRREEVTLSQAGEFTNEPALFVPAPVVAWSLCGIGSWLVPGFAPPELSPMQKVQRFSLQNWFWLLTSAMIGIATAWDCRRREQIWGRKGWVWPVTVGLLGLFGWVGYVCLRPLPQRRPDGEWMIHPPEPNPPLGIEIFA
ncbi:MAG: hypothetical protein WCJ09_11520 [Planctomycetota bacterium]